MKTSLIVRQLVDYPRCRIYRGFLRGLEQDATIKVLKTSYLYYYILLCSYANYRTSYRRIGKTSHVIGPGEWIFQQKELMRCFRVNRPGLLYPILEVLEQNHYISLVRLNEGKLIKVRIREWKKFNTALEYNAPCEKAEGFFFVPVSVTEELIGLGRCSEMDALLDLWLHAVYQDERVQGSELGGVVYYRNGSGSPVLSYSQLGERWSVSKATVCRILNKLYHRGYLVVMSFSGRSGSAIYLSGYLSTMFQLSDTELDKQEVALALELVVKTEAAVISVSEEENSVSILHGEKLLANIGRSLGAHGFPCPLCKSSQYKLYELSGGSGKASSPPLRCMLEFRCQAGDQVYRFEITQISEGGADHE